MAIVNGQPVDAPFSNAAWISKNTDDTATGKTSWNNTDPLSGPAVTNIQREVNSLNSYTGRPSGTAQNATPVWTNSQIGTTLDDLKARVDLITRTFSGTTGTGHSHSGVDAEGPNIPSTSVNPCPLKGSFLEGTDITGVTGLSTDVSTIMAGKVDSTGSSSVGVVVTGSYNRVVIRQATGVNTNDPYEDGSGNQVYGRITFATPIWTLSYYVDISGTETPYSFSSASDVRWYYQELFNPLSGLAPVYSELAIIPSDNATADVITATTTEQGKVQLSTIPGGAISSGGSAGTANATVANADHSHPGVHNIGVFGVVGTPVLGDVLFEAGSGTSIDYNSGRIRINASGAVAYQEMPTGLSNGVNVTFGPLAHTPSNAQSVIVFLDGIATSSTDWSLVGTSIVFVAPPAFGQKVYVFYVSGGTVTPPPPPSGTENVEYRTITSPEITAGQLLLVNVPTSAALVMVDVIGGCAQEFNVDFTVASNNLIWTGYALSPILALGDKLRIHYWS